MPLNHAFVDASWQEQPDGQGLGGWGLVLLRPGQLAARYQGQMGAPDNNAAELRAVLEAVRAAPAGEPLTVHTDNQAVIIAVSRGRGPQSLTEASREVHEESSGRGLSLRAKYAPRTGRHMQSAHLLANDARKGQGTAALTLPQTDVLIEQRPVGPETGGPEARVSLRRVGERVTAHVPLDPLSPLPPSAQALLAAVGLARPGEHLTVRRASKIAQAIWHRPERALPSAYPAVALARTQADEQGVQVEFLGVG